MPRGKGRRMAERSVALRKSAEECLEMAGKATDPVIEREFRNMARLFAELADHIDEKAMRAALAANKPKPASGKTR